jgi:hypothetical protein
MIPHPRLVNLLAFVTLVLLIVGGCQIVQDIRPRNVGEGILLADALITQTADTVGTLRRQGQIPFEVAQDQADRLRTAAAQVDAAREAYLIYRSATDDSEASESALSEAEAKLEEAIQTARAVQSYAETWK